MAKEIFNKWDVFTINSLISNFSYVSDRELCLKFTIQDEHQELDRKEVKELIYVLDKWVIETTNKHICSFTEHCKNEVHKCPYVYVVNHCECHCWYGDM